MFLKCILTIMTGAAFLMGLASFAYLLFHPRSWIEELKKIDTTPTE